MLKMNARSLLSRAALGAAALVVGALGALPAPAAHAAAPRPNLVVASFSATPGQLRAGGSVTVSARVRNAGPGRAGASKAGFMLSADRRVDRRDVRLGAPRPVRPLGARATASVTARVTVPAGTKAGAYWLIACADAGGAVRESNERDNCTRMVRLRVLAGAGTAPSSDPTTGPLLPPGSGPLLPPIGGGPGTQPDPGGSHPDPGPGGGTDPNPGGGTDPNPGSGGTDPGTDPGGGTDPNPGGGTDPNPGGGTDPGTDPGGGDPGRGPLPTPPSLSIAGATVSETAGSVTLTVTLAGETELPASVDWATHDGTATAPADYAASGGRLTFAPGETEQTVTVPLVDDAVIEDDETFTVVLSDPVDATIAAGSATVTVTSDDVAAGLLLNELHPRLTSNRVELLVTATGTLDRARVAFSQTPAANVTLPPLAVSAGDLVVLHFKAPPIVGETTAKGECAPATFPACSDGAWDLVGGSANFSAAGEVVTVARPDGTLQDAVPFASVTPAPAASFYQALQSIQAQGLWRPVDCNGTLCTATSFPTGRDVSVDWTSVPMNGSGTSVRRIVAADSDSRDDWAVGPSSFGLPNL
jgi:Calx-beta domain/CARDB